MLSSSAEKNQLPTALDSIALQEMIEKLKAELQILTERNAHLEKQLKQLNITQTTAIGAINLNTTSCFLPTQSMRRSFSDTKLFSPPPPPQGSHNMALLYQVENGDMPTTPEGISLPRPRPSVPNTGTGRRICQDQELSTIRENVIKKLQKYLEPWWRWKNHNRRAAFVIKAITEDAKTIADIHSILMNQKDLLEGNDRNPTQIGFKKPQEKTKGYALYCSFFVKNKKKELHKSHYYQSINNALVEFNRSPIDSLRGGATPPA